MSRPSAELARPVAPGWNRRRDRGLPPSVGEISHGWVRLVGRPGARGSSSGLDTVGGVVGGGPGPGTTTGSGAEVRPECFRGSGGGGGGKGGGPMSGEYTVTLSRVSAKEARLGGRTAVVPEDWVLEGGATGRSVDCREVSTPPTEDGLAVSGDFWVSIAFATTAALLASWAAFSSALWRRAAWTGVSFAGGRRNSCGGPRCTTVHSPSFILCLSIGVSPLSV